MGDKEVAKKFKQLVSVGRKDALHMQSSWRAGGAMLQQTDKDRKQLNALHLMLNLLEGIYD